MFKIVSLLIVFGLFFQGQSFQIQKSLQSPSFYTFSSLHDQKGNVTDVELNKIKTAISNAENLYSDQNRISKAIFEAIKGPTYQFWDVYAIADGVRDIGLYATQLLQNKYIWLKYGKYNYTYLLYSRWIKSDYNGTGGSLSEFGELITPSQKQQIYEIVNNAILYRGNNIEGQAQYIYPKINQLIFGKGRWSIVIMDPTVQYGYFVSRTFQIWVAFRSYGQLKWSYFMNVG